MRIDHLRLIAYGPFTDVALDFSKGHGDFHLVFGPNEAGKSSALRALRGLLFGIPVRTGDSFRHPNPKLRIGASLTRSDGQQIDFVRRKGQRKTLRGADGQSLLEETSLRPFLGGIDRDFFEQMFAIGHDDLVQGGEEIIAGGGSVGQALFAAGAGLLRLQAFQQRLANDCEDLFKSTGKKPRINNTLSALKRTRQNQKAALLQARTWQSHHEALTEARKRLDAVQQTLAAKHQRRGLLKRVDEALPLMARRREIDALLDTYADLPELPDHFSAQRRDTQEALKLGLNDLNRSQAHIEELQKGINALEVPGELLENAPLVEALQHELGSFNKAQEDRPVLKARMGHLYQQAATSLSEAGTRELQDGETAFQLPATLAAEIQELGQADERLRTRLETVRERRHQLDHEVADLVRQREALKTPADVEALKITLQIVQDAGPLGRQLAEARRAIAVQEKNLNRALQRQTLWNGNLEELDTLAIPTRESIDQFENRLNALAHEREKMQSEKAKKEEELSRIDIELHTIAVSHDVPTEEDLKAARDLREAGWQLVRCRLEDRARDHAEEGLFSARIQQHLTLPEAFETSVRRADQVADRLRREAEQVSRKSLLEARRNQYAAELQTIATARETVRENQSACDEQWRQLWKPLRIDPSSPWEMRAWLATVLSIREKIDTLRSDRVKADQIGAEADGLRTQLIQAMTDVGLATDTSASLASLIAAARPYVARQEKCQTQIESISKERRKQNRALRALKTERGALEEESENWRRLWAQKVSRLGLDDNASPRVAAAVIESIREAKAHRDEADILQKRIQGIDRDADKFRARVADLVTRLTPEIEGEPPDRAAQILNTRINAAREIQTAHHGLQQQLINARSDHISVQKRVDDATMVLQALCREANCHDAEMLPEVEQRNTQRRQLIHEREVLEDRLRHLSAGATVEAFIHEASAVEADRIASDLEQLSQDIDALERDRAAFNQTVGTERAELRHMDGRAAAAGHAEDAERLLASLDADVEQYARLKLASVILGQTIEQYREKHQGPLINRASELFARMTTGAFRGVRAEYDEKGHPVLVGIRSGNGEQVRMGGLSDGTADQLYLSLRIASIEQYLDTSEALPFVVDDILMRFDDERAAATLEVLAELTAHSQVIFFTHHQHMVDLARQRIDAEILQVHRL